MTKQEYLICPICGAQTKDYFISISGSLITDVKCTNRKCFFSSNYVPINVWDRYMHMVERCYSLEAENTNLKTEIAQLQADNRSLVEQMNQMALKPNQEIIEWIYTLYNPEINRIYNLPTEDRLCIIELFSGKYDLVWWIGDGLDETGWDGYGEGEVKRWAYLPKGVNND